MGTDLIGRHAEVAHLSEMLDALSEGTASCVAVAGEPGIGKTTLLSELRRLADDRGCLVLSGAAAEFERDVPFSVWADTLDAYMASQDHVPLAVGATEADAADLAAILPSRGTVLAQPLADERYRTHRATRRLLESLAADRPLVLVLDDLHWADRASVELIAALLRREPAAAVLIALGCRSGRPTETLGAALAEPIVRLIELTPLSEGDALALAGEHLAPQTRAAIVKDGGGNPFYTLQLARMSEPLTRTSAGDRVADDADVPALVAAALLVELSALSPRALALLRAAAVAGDPVAFELALSTAQMPEEAGYHALDELIGADLLRATDRPRMFAFRHPLVRRAVYASIRHGSRLAAHARAASALEDLGAGALERAHHVDMSAVRGDAAAVSTLIEAGDASAHTSPTGAARWYAAARRLTPDGDRSGRLRALTRLAGALGSAGEPAGSRETLLQALELVAGSDPRLTVQLTAACAACEDFLGLHAAARARLETALETLPDERSPEAVSVLLKLAAGAWFTIDFERMGETAMRARDAAEPLQDTGLLGAAFAALALADVVQGQIDDASSNRQAAATLLDGLPDAELALHLEAVNHLGWTELYLERFADAIRHMSRGVAVARVTGRGAFISFMEECQALAELLLGHADAAQALHEDAVDGARLAGLDYVLATALATAAISHLVDGDIEAASRDADEALALTREGNAFIAGLAGAAGLVAAVTAAHSTSLDERLLTAAGGWGIDVLPPWWRVMFQSRLTDALLEAGELERAERSTAAAEAAATGLGLPLCGAMAQYARAAVLLATNRAAAAAELALNAAEAADEAGVPVEAARSRKLAGKALAASGDRTRAIAILRDAEKVLGTCQAVRDRDDARRSLRKLGARIEPRGPAASSETGVGSLTSREHEVAGLVTARMTNREVAAQLFLSEKTVESHLRNIFFKLGASSRVDVARAVEAHQGVPKATYA